MIDSRFIDTRFIDTPLIDTRLIDTPFIDKIIDRHPIDQNCRNFFAIFSSASKIPAILVPTYLLQAYFWG
jgi:hypothetical protein